MRILLGSLLIACASLVAHCQEPIGVCNLLKTAKHYDHKTVVATGFVYADIHHTGIGSKECLGGVVIRYDFSSVPDGFSAGVESKRRRDDVRPFKVTVRGKFFAHVRGPRGYLSRIEVSRVLEWSFVDEKGSAPAQ